jgi:hypothetical protein
MRRVAVAQDQDDPRRPLKCPVAGRLPCEPVEVEALVGSAERVEWIAHPNAPASESDLLRENALGQDRSSTGTL